MADPADLEDFLAHLTSERRCSPHTVAAYRRDLTVFKRLSALEDWRACKAHHARLHVGKLHAQGRSPRTISRALASIRSFYTFLVRERRIAANPAANIRAPKQTKPLPKTLDTDQAARLFDYDPTSRIELRDRAIMELFYGSGLRPSTLAREIAKVQYPLDLSHLHLR